MCQPGPKTDAERGTAMQLFMAGSLIALLCNLGCGLEGLVSNNLNATCVEVGKNASSSGSPWEQVCGEGQKNGNKIRDCDGALLGFSLMNDELCERCQGDCDDDGDCAGNLVCSSGGGDVRGCPNGDKGKTSLFSDDDFCEDPKSSTAFNMAGTGMRTLHFLLSSVMGLFAVCAILMKASRKAFLKAYLSCGTFYLLYLVWSVWKLVGFYQSWLSGVYIILRFIEVVTMLAATSNTCTASSDKDISAGVGPGDPIIYAIGAAPQEVIMAAFAPSVAQPSFMMLQCPAGAGPGAVVQAQTPSGQTIQVTVPPNVGEGMQFQVQVPTP